MKWLDDMMEQGARGVARRSSRRSFMARLGVLIAGGAAAFPLLPVARGSEHEEEIDLDADPGDPTSCDYWRYCAVDGFLCACCGGTQSSCPPGTQMSPVTWIGTCRNPADDQDYIISYNDCCGKSACGACNCNRNEGDMPIYRPQLSNAYNWCLGTDSAMYNCSTSRVIGVARKS